MRFFWFCELCDKLLTESESDPRDEPGGPSRCPACENPCDLRAQCPHCEGSGWVEPTQSPERRPVW